MVCTSRPAISLDGGTQRAARKTSRGYVHQPEEKGGLAPLHVAAQMRVTQRVEHFELRCTAYTATTERPRYPHDRTKRTAFLTANWLYNDARYSGVATKTKQKDRMSVSQILVRWRWNTSYILQVRVTYTLSTRGIQCLACNNRQVRFVDWWTADAINGTGR